MTDQPILAYWFALADKQGRVYSPNKPWEKWVEGQGRTLRGEIIPCERGYHASPTLWDALTYAPGPVACLVELSGTIVPHDADKYAASTRKLIRAVNVERELREFAADCAEHVLPIYERKFPGDDRPRKAIEAARAYARGEISADGLGAALAAARAAARAELAAARAARAARAAARAAAAAARAAASAATWAAADAAADAAWAAAAESERAWQRERFEARFGRIFEEVTA